jgi:hypothetical protein
LPSLRIIPPHNQTLAPQFIPPMPIIHCTEKLRKAMGLKNASSVHSHKIPSIISRLNHFPIGSIQWRDPVDAMREEIKIIN